MFVNALGDLACVDLLDDGTVGVETLKVDWLLGLRIFSYGGSHGASKVGENFGSVILKVKIFSPCKISSRPLGGCSRKEV